MTDILAPFKRQHSNRLAVDRLGSLREHRRDVDELEKELKREVCGLMGSADSLGGDEFIARQRLVERRGSIDDKAAKDDGVDLDAYRKPASTTHILDVKRRTEASA